MSLRIDILTLFPEVFQAFLETSIPGRAASKGRVSYHLTNIRDFSTDAHRSVDDRPCGGGPGMILMAPVLCDAAGKVAALDPRPPRIIILSPQGRRFDQSVATELAGESRLMLLAGRYEGFDDRIAPAIGATELSIGDYVLSGGEIAAMAVIDAVVRLLPGVLGAEQGPVEESFADGLLEHPQYTWPREFRGMIVPDVLFSGNHRRIEQWRARQRRERTRQRRPDLWEAWQRPKRSGASEDPGPGSCRPDAEQDS